MTLQNRIVRLPEVIAVTGLSRATIYRKMKAGTFPKRYKIGTNAIGWRRADLDAWLADPR